MTSGHKVLLDIANAVRISRGYIYAPRSRRHDCNGSEKKRLLEVWPRRVGRAAGGGTTSLAEHRTHPRGSRPTWTGGDTPSECRRDEEDGVAWGWILLS